MKQTLLILLSSLLLMAAGKDLRVLVMTPTPQMHCENCENKIKKNLRFESGVKKIQAAMKDIGYDTKVVSDTPKEKEKEKK